MTGLSIRKAQFDAWKIAEDKGFHEGRTGAGRDDTLVRLCLVHTEVSEAAQEVKRHWDGGPTESQKAAFAEELADVLIRVFDVAQCVGVDLESAVAEKMAKNANRFRLYGTAKQEAVR